MFYHCYCCLQQTLFEVQSEDLSFFDAVHVFDNSEQAFHSVNFSNVPGEQNFSIICIY